MTKSEMWTRVDSKLSTMKDGEIRIIVRNGEIKHVNTLEEIKEPTRHSENHSQNFETCYNHK